MMKKCFLLLLTVKFLAATHVYFNVLAGGFGERLWPLSRKDFPKQFLSLDNKKSLLDIALERVDNVVENSFKWVITTKDCAQLVKKHVGNKVDNIFVEPALRNTGPAICLTAMKIAQKEPDAILVFLASDHFIYPVDKFKRALKTAIDYATNHDEIVLLGIKPTFPATGYGYIQLEERYLADKVMKVVGFHEKPSLEKAKEYLQTGMMVWNGAYFFGKASIFVEEFRRYAPDIVAGIDKFLKNEDSYESLRNISIDFAVMEKTKNLKAVLLDADWSDVGNLTIFLSLRNQLTKNRKNIISLNAQNNLVFSKNEKQIVLLGVKDLAIVDMDDALVISRQEQVEEVKNAVNILKKENSTLI